MVTEGTKKQAHQKRTKVAAKPPTARTNQSTDRPPVRLLERLGDNQATNHNRTQSTGRSVTTPTPSLPPPNDFDVDAVERPAVHVKRRQLEKCRDSAAVVETRQKICKSKIKQTHLPLYQRRTNEPMDGQTVGRTTGRRHSRRSAAFDI